MPISRTVKALSSKTRRDIVALLGRGRMTAGEIAEHFDLTQATVSHHLAVLMDSGLITDQKKGRFIIYELTTSVIDEMIVYLQSLRGEDND